MMMKAPAVLYPRTVGAFSFGGSAVLHMHGPVLPAVGRPLGGTGALVEAANTIQFGNPLT